MVSLSGSFLLRKWRYPCHISITADLGIRHIDRSIFRVHFIRDVRLLYVYNGHRFTGTVLQAGMHCIRVRVENSIQEHFIEYRDILEIGEEGMGLR